MVQREVAQSQHQTTQDLRYILYILTFFIYHTISLQLFFSLFIWILDQVLFLGIQNIHTMRDSLFRLRDYVDTHGSVSSNGTSSAVSLVGDRVSLWFVLLNYHLQYTFPWSKVRLCLCQASCRLLHTWAWCQPFLTYLNPLPASLAAIYIV